MKNKDLKYSVGFQGGICTDNKFWFPSFLGNALLCSDQNGIVEYIGKFPEEKDYVDKLYGEVKNYKNKLLFIPLGARNISVYDLNYKKFKSIPIQYQTDQIAGLFFSAAIHNDFMYIFPSYYCGILKVNLKNWHMEVISKWIKEANKFLVSPKEAYFRSDYVRRGDLIYLPFCNAHAVLEFDLSKEKTRIFDVGKTGYSTIADDGERFWLSPRKEGAIVCWNPRNNKINYYENFPKGYYPGSAVGSFCYGDYYWVFPEHANKALKVNRYTGNIIENKFFSDVCNTRYSHYSIWDVPFIFCKKYKDMVVLCTGKSSEIIYFNLLSGEIKRKVLRVPDELKKAYEDRIQIRAKYEQLIGEKKGYYSETSRYVLEEFWDCIRTDKEYFTKENIGKKIYDFCL